MRQGQQNRRGRGRNNNNNNNGGRKNQNPLTRSFESNGPDVKIRGTPSHIAEKYISLARDAQSSGDPVLAENYMQHAEHYNRIIMAYREQQMQHGGDPGPVLARRPQISGDFVEGDDFDDDGEETGAENGQPVVGQGFMGANEPQPVVRSFDPVRGEGGQESRPERRHEGREQHREGRRGDFHLRPHRERHQGERHQGQGSNPRHEGRPDYRQERPDNRSDNRPDNRQDNRPESRVDSRAEGRPERGPDNRSESRQDSRPERADTRPDLRHEGRADSPGPREAGSRRDHHPRPRRDQFGGGDQPEFLRRPVRRPRREGPADEAVGAPAAEPAATTADDSAE